MVRSLNVLMYQKGANTRLREMPPAPARLSRLNYSRQYAGWFLDRERGSGFTRFRPKRGDASDADPPEQAANADEDSDAFHPSPLSEGIDEWVLEQIRDPAEMRIDDLPIPELTIYRAVPI
jgi:hypothetical protein